MAGDVFGYITRITNYVQFGVFAVGPPIHGMVFRGLWWKAFGIGDIGGVPTIRQPRCCSSLCVLFSLPLFLPSTLNTLVPAGFNMPWIQCGWIKGPKYIQ